MNKMNSVKRLFSIFLILIMCVSLVPSSAFAANPVTITADQTPSQMAAEETDSQSSEDESGTESSSTEPAQASASPTEETPQETAAPQESAQPQLDATPVPEETSSPEEDQDSLFTSVKVKFLCSELEDLSGLYVYDAAGNELTPYYDEAIDDFLYDTYVLAPGEYTYDLHDENGDYKDISGAAFSVSGKYEEQRLTIVPEAAEKKETDVELYSLTVVNPIYVDVIEESDIPETKLTDDQIVEIIEDAQPSDNSTGSAAASTYNSSAGQIIIAANTAYTSTSSGATINTSISEAGALLRTKLVARNAEIRIYLELPSEGNWDSLCSEIYSNAIAHTGVPTQGDYLHFEYGGYNASGATKQDGDTGSYLYLFIYTPLYYTTAAQERTMTSKVNSILSKLSLSGKSDYQKIRAIYDYLCTNVSYDYTNLNDDSYTLKYTGYAALVKNTAVCQGYSVAFYRLCLEAGIDARVISSQAMNHAWNIVHFQNSYYELDSTWDAGQSSYSYFLKGSTNWLAKHKTGGISTLGDEYKNSSFASKYAVPSADASITSILSYDANGGSGAPAAQTKEVGTSIAISNMIPTREGFTFIGWALTANAETAEYQPGNTFSDDSNTVLYAVWMQAENSEPDEQGDQEEDQTEEPVEPQPEESWPISYVLNNEKAVNASDNPESYSRSALPITLSSPTADGYTFAGWYLDEGLTVAASQPQIGSTATGTLTFYAKWMPISYSIRFSSNGGTGIMRMLTSQTVLSGEISVVNTFKRTGYIFNGWNTKADGSGESFNETLTVMELAPYAADKSIMLYAQWKPITYTVSFDANGGSGSMESMTFTYGTAQSLAPNAFTKTGYSLSGWKCGSRSYSDCQSVKDLSKENGAEITMIAQWRADTSYAGYNYSVQFDGNGNTGGRTSTEAMRIGSARSLTSNGYTKTGYHFAGWATEAEGDIVYTDRQSVKDLNIEYLQNPVILYAVWEPNTYSVSFSAGGGYLMEGTKKITTYKQAESSTYGISFPLDANRFIRAGYTFKEWNTLANGKGTAYSDGAEAVNLSASNNGRVTLYAIWTANTYTISYDANQGAGTMEPQIAVYNSSVRLNSNTFLRAGYSFKNWSGSNGKTYSNKATVRNLCTENGETITLTANWTANTYTVRFSSNGGRGTVPASLKGAGDVPVLIPENTLTFAGYRFKEWNTKADGTGTAYLPGESIVLNTKNGASVTLYAVWTYTVTFNPGAGTGIAFTDEMVYNRTAAVDAADFSREGYYLAGWNKNAVSAAKGSVQYRTTALKNVGTDATLYAVWKPYK